MFGQYPGQSIAQTFAGKISEVSGIKSPTNPHQRGDDYEVKATLPKPQCAIAIPERRMQCKCIKFKFTRSGKCSAFVLCRSNDLFN